MWQPIETAPKDGTYVLVYPATWNNLSCSMARYNDDACAKKPIPYWDRVDSFGLVTVSRDNLPTHWMSLPEPPVGG